MQMLSMFTIILTTVLTLSGAYSFFSSRLKEEIKSSAVMLADVANGSENPADTLKTLKNRKGQQISRFGADGSLLFENSA